MAILLLHTTAYIKYNRKEYSFNFHSLITIMKKLINIIHLFLILSNMKIKYIRRVTLGLSRLWWKLMKIIVGRTVRTVWIWLALISKKLTTCHLPSHETNCKRSQQTNLPNSYPENYPHKPATWAPVHRRPAR